MNIQVNPSTNRDLVLTRLFDAPPEKLFRAWTEPLLVKQWFAPQPWTVSGARIDARPGGSTLVVMRDPDGNDHPSEGVYLEVVPNRKLVFTDAYTSAWTPSQKPFMTVVLTFEEEPDGRTKYTALARHWTAEDREAHETMGFHQGWERCTDQLAELLQTF